MTFQLSGFSRRSITLAAAVFAVASVAIGAHAPQTGAAAQKTSRLAVVIGKGHSPAAHAPLTQPINDARAISAALRREGFDVDVLENASRNDIDRAVDRLN